MVDTILQPLNLKKINSCMSKTKLIINNNRSIKIEGDFDNGLLVL
jgi:hypothetical protein